VGEAQAQPQHSFETDIVGENGEDDATLILNGNDSVIKTVLILVGTSCFLEIARMHAKLSRFTSLSRLQLWKPRHFPWWNT